MDSMRSAGCRKATPTELVRNGSTISNDKVPEGPPTVEPVRIAAEGPGNTGAEVRRADDAEGCDGDTMHNAARAAWDTFDRWVPGPM